MRRLASTWAAPASAANPHVYSALLYTYAAASPEELTAKRAPLRAAHLLHAGAAKAAGKLVMGGAFGDVPIGGLLLFRATVEEAEAFAKADPYTLGGLVTSFKVRPWMVVIDGLSGSTAQ